MVVGARNPEGVSCAQRPSCRLSQAFRFNNNTFLRSVLWYYLYIPSVRMELGKKYGKCAT
jgi:hypothetical protein